MFTTFIQTGDTSHKGSFNAYKHDNDVPVANMLCYSHLEIIAQLPHNQLTDCPIIILGNKCDLEDDICITNNELNEVSQMCNIECFETSVVTGMNVEKSLLSIIQLAYNHKFKNA